MLSKSAIYTIFTRAIIVAANFGLVVFSTHIWGSDGRGIIALILADISLITILNNVSSGSTISFHAPKVSINLIYSIAFPTTLITSLIGAMIFSIIQGFDYFFYMFAISLLISYSTSVSLYWLGKNRINRYNLFNLFPPLLILFFLFVLYYLLNITNIDVYFYAYFLSYGIIASIGLYKLFKNKGLKYVFNFEVSKKILNYGAKSEISYFIQFLNSRLSYFFISSWLGLAKLGLFSVAIALSEAIWIISKSISAIHYSNIINSDDAIQRIKMTEKAAFTSFVFSMFAIIIIYFIPEQIFSATFGEDFSGVKNLIIYLFPGIIAISISNIYGHYFSGIGKMRILIVKSLLGLVVTVVLLFLLLNELGLKGACITLDIAYITSSIYLFVMFYKDKKKILMLNHSIV